MPKRRKRESFEADETDTCAICFDDFPVRDMVLLNTCNHKYCEECINEWFKRENTCPQCKARVTLIDIPGRKRRKRVKRVDLVTDDTDNEMAHLVRSTVATYIASRSFRNYVAHNVIRRNSAFDEMWEVLQHAVPILHQQAREQLLFDNEINPVIYQVMEAADAISRLNHAYLTTSSHL